MSLTLTLALCLAQTTPPSRPPKPVRPAPVRPEAKPAPQAKPPLTTAPPNGAPKDSPKVLQEIRRKRKLAKSQR